MELNSYSSDQLLGINTSRGNPGFDNVFPDNGNWVKSTFLFKMQKEFDTYKEMLEYSLSDELFSNNLKPQTETNMQGLIEDAGTSDTEIPKEILDRKYRDTSLGGNDAINCYYQFCEFDDIIHPHNSLGFDTGRHGMGRVYSETIDDNQQIMYMGFGLANFTGLKEFYSNAISNEIADMMNGGKFLSAKHIGRLLGKTAGIVLTLPFAPLIVLKKCYDMLPNIDKRRVTKYYDIQLEMGLYYKCVNTMLAHLVVNLGFVSPEGKDLGNAQSTTKDQSYYELYKNDTGDKGGLPEVFQKHGFDIFSIMTKKYLYSNIGEITNYDDLNLDNLVERYMEFGDRRTPEEKAEGFSPFDLFYKSVLKAKGTFGAGIADGMSYVGFRIEKSVDNTESISNSTGESSIASTLNGRSSESQETRFKFQNGKTGFGIIDSFLGATTEIFKGTLGAVGLDGLTGILKGSGRIDIPEVWKSSSFTKTYSFNMALRSPYGDPVSIFQSIYVPLSMLLAAALPRAVGSNAYTSPFLVSAYSKGMFAIPLGMIDSITIKRGSDQHGWNYKSLPTSVDVSFSIKDLSPAMYMGIAGTESWWNILGQNSTFQEYLLTLSGSSMADRLLWLRTMKRRHEIIKQVWRHNKLNPHSWGFSANESKLGRILSACNPISDFEGGRNG
jgi:hypothetical protein